MSNQFGRPIVHDHAFGRDLDRIGLKLKQEGVPCWTVDYLCNHNKPHICFLSSAGCQHYSTELGSMSLLGRMPPLGRMADIGPLLDQSEGLYPA